MHSIQGRRSGEETLMNTFQDSREGYIARALAWLAVTLFSACAYNVFLVLFAMPTAGRGVSADWLVTTFGLGVLFFGLGFVWGPIALAFLVLVLGEQLKHWVTVSLRWTWCCPGAGSKGVGLLALGPAF